MRVMTHRAVCLFAAGVLITTTGCPMVNTRTTNQGGGSLITAGTKLVNNRVGALNPDEWQILTDNAPTIAANFGIDLGVLGSLPQMTDEEASAIVGFLVDNNVMTFEDFDRLVTDIALGRVQVPQELIDLADAMVAQAT